MEFWDYHPKQDNLLDLVREGLSSHPKWLPALMLYNKKGSELFDQICDQPEYYLTDAEQEILATQSEALRELVPSNGAFLELGAGSPDKARLLFDAMEEKGTTYFPLDISKAYLTAQMEALTAKRPNLRVNPVCANFLDGEVVASLADRLSAFSPRIAYFPGSTIGNMEPDTALALMKYVGQLVGKGGDFLVAVDLKKDRKTLEAAYDDRAGVTAAFEKNVLQRLNEEWDANFDLDAFAYRATYLEDEGRLEMALVSQTHQEVTIGNDRFSFGSGEVLRVENSFKYTVEEFGALGRRAGFEMVQVWTDAKQQFSLHHWRSEGSA